MFIHQLSVCHIFKIFLLLLNLPIPCYCSVNVHWNLQISVSKYRVHFLHFHSWYSIWIRLVVQQHAGWSWFVLSASVDKGASRINIVHFTHLTKTVVWESKYGDINCFINITKAFQHCMNKIETLQKISEFTSHLGIEPFFPSRKCQIFHLSTCKKKFLILN